MHENPCPKCSYDVNAQLREQALHLFYVEGHTGEIEIACDQCENEILAHVEWHPTWFQIRNRPTPHARRLGCTAAQHEDCGDPGCCPENPIVDTTPSA